MKWTLIIVLVSVALHGIAQPYTRQDTLRGTNGRGRSWWDVQRYRVNMSIDTAQKTIIGICWIDFKIIGKAGDSMQIDLQEGLHVDKAGGMGQAISFQREGNVTWLKPKKSDMKIGHHYRIFITYSGVPKVAAHPPWDGGFIWTHDSLGRQWIAVACQGTGASCWWPCKDYQGDEPDSGMSLHIDMTSANGFYDQSFIGNGRQSSERNCNGSAMTVHGCVPLYSTDTLFSVKNPINTYDATFYIGQYTHWHDTLHGEKGILDLSFYPLSYNEAKARKHWAVTKDMLRCFEYWMGPYPFYEDGYKLVEAPYLGMEHQSAVAYGNQYKMGYLGMDRSGTGVGLSFDFIIIHESGHEWFGNSITARDVADNWIHEGFTTYTEALFAEWIKGRDSGFAYAVGSFKNIKNDKPVIGDYGVNNEGSGDMYNKGAAVVHMVRMMLHDDERFRQLLKGLNREFYHKIVTSKQVEDYISKFVGRDLKAFFDQYLRAKDVPVVEVTPSNRVGSAKGGYRVRVSNCVKGFTLSVYSAQGRFVMELGEEWKEVSGYDKEALRNYLVRVGE